MDDVVDTNTVGPSAVGPSAVSLSARSPLDPESRLSRDSELTSGGLRRGLVPNTDR